MWRGVWSPLTEIVAQFSSSAIVITTDFFKCSVLVCTNIKPLGICIQKRISPASGDVQIHRARRDRHPHLARDCIYVVMHSSGRRRRARSFSSLNRPRFCRRHTRQCCLMNGAGENDSSGGSSKASAGGAMAVLALVGASATR